jgi:hypothetical protein
MSALLKTKDYKVSQSKPEECNACALAMPENSIYTFQLPGTGDHTTLKIIVLLF